MRDSYKKSDKFLNRGIDAFSKRKELLSEIEERFARSQKVKLLEIGCGQGKLLLDLLAKFPSINLDGINASKEHGLTSQKDFQKRVKEWDVKIPPTAKLPQLHIGSVTNLPFKKNVFDLIISQVTFIHVENKARGIEEVIRVLKPNGIAIIAIGPYSIRRKHGHTMPPFYKNLRRKLVDDLNPRFLVKSNNHVLPFSEVVQLMNTRAIEITLSSVQFTSETQRAKGYWLVIRKKRDEEVTFPFKYLRKDSQKLTDLYSKKNPVNWGVIDLYELATTSNQSSNVAH